MFRPLEGRKVVDLTQVLAGPFCAYQLALLGADVIKIEPPDGGDWARAGGADRELEAAGMAMGFLTQNAGKRSIAIDLKTDAGHRLALELAADADVFLENFRPGTAARLGLSDADVRAVNPNVVYASLSAYGQDGPMSKRPAYDHVVQAVSGIMQLTGDPDTLPNKVGAPYVDYATGLNGAFAILAALMERDRTGEGQRVDVAMLDSALILMASHLTQTTMTGDAPVAAGNEAFSGAPASGVFETADGLLALAANNDRQLGRLLKALDLEAMAVDPRYADKDARRENMAAFRAAIAAALTADSADAWEARFADADVPAARIRDLGEALSSDQVAARGLMTDYVSPALGRRVTVPAGAFKANGAAPRAEAPPPTLAQDADAILGGLGKSAEEIQELRAMGVVL